ncbi:hypothetical protein SAMN05216215_1002293 [Saccharopolyspora shandongensis]|uniref:Uncharacterized protein n=1 Tax=Saccharopolyspora shandongensis TaxID=418495 RepID=A0A1H2SQ46_9PSEU|nr:hypothetical protein SAMN05216215_1002293 [Saccharopolyspora shandongensis]
MSEDVLSVIPADPRWQPDRAAADRAAAVAARLAPGTAGGASVEIRMTWHDEMTAIDCGDNLERIGCPHCGASIDLTWWSGLLEVLRGAGFETLAVQVPCCRAAVLPCRSVVGRVGLRLAVRLRPLRDRHLESGAHLVRRGGARRPRSSARTSGESDPRPPLTDGVPWAPGRGDRPVRLAGCSRYAPRSGSTRLGENRFHRPGMRCYVLRHGLSRCLCLLHPVAFRLGGAGSVFAPPSASGLSFPDARFVVR